MTATEYVILVDEHDNPIGTAEKLSAHQKNQLHRAFSIFIFRNSSPPALLLQQRASHKYHSPGLWTNTCCSHPRPGEDILLAGQRRLYEEMGITTELKHRGWFHYNAHFLNGLSENEIDHVLVGRVSLDIEIKLNPDEAASYRWITIKDLKAELKANPGMFTPWLERALSLAD